MKINRWREYVDRFRTTRKKDRGEILRYIVASKKSISIGRRIFLEVTILVAGINSVEEKDYLKLKQYWMITITVNRLEKTVDENRYG